MVVVAYGATDRQYIVNQNDTHDSCLSSIFYCRLGKTLWCGYSNFVVSTWRCLYHVSIHILRVLRELCGLHELREGELRGSTTINKKITQTKQ